MAPKRKIYIYATSKVRPIIMLFHGNLRTSKTCDFFTFFLCVLGLRSSKVLGLKRRDSTGNSLFAMQLGRGLP